MDVLPQHDLDKSTGARYSQRWHPKLTPYRTLFILATLILGTGKAVLTQQGRTVVPVTLEWVSGVVLALVFYTTSSYDTEGRTPQYLSWFFKFDCMDLIWHFLSLFSIRRPLYRSKELSALPSTYPGHPPITLYRIGLNMTVILFGMSKAVLGYAGPSTAVTWFDWFLGTMLTTGFYILRLYEFNASNTWAPFFQYDRVRFVLSVNKKILRIILGAFYLSVIVLLSGAQWTIWHDLKLHDLDVTPTFMESAFEFFYKACASLILLFILLWHVSQIFVYFLYF